MEKTSGGVIYLKLNNNLNNNQNNENLKHSLLNENRKLDNLRDVKIRAYF